MPEKSQNPKPSETPYGKKTYCALACDPIHIGTGGYRLGRVDNTIVREPGTNLPKIPGTSLSGVARAYTALQAGRYRYQDDAGVWRSCAGKGGGQGDDHCGDPGCCVCTTYGFSKGEERSSFQGLAQFFDARILLFPVHSIKGPVWVTSPTALNDFVGALETDSDPRTVQTKFHLSDTDEELQTDVVEDKQPLSLGWLLLTNKKKDSPVTGTLPEFPQEMMKRLVLVSDKLFPRVVNDNLEVRTSVAINPETGAAEEGALYSYEAIPRAAALWFEVVFNKPDFFTIKRKPIQRDGKVATWEDVLGDVETGLVLMEHLGVGGMGTRGMGRLKVLNAGGRGVMQ